MNSLSRMTIFLLFVIGMISLNVGAQEGCKTEGKASAKRASRYGKSKAQEAGIIPAVDLSKPKTPTVEFIKCENQSSCVEKLNELTSAAEKSKTEYLVAEFISGDEPGLQVFRHQK